MKYVTDDIDYGCEYLNMILGGNGDYYITIGNQPDRKQYTVKICMSGGKASTKLKLAVAKLYEALLEYDNEGESIK